jgi:hypothetical protein
MSTQVYTLAADGTGKWSSPGRKRIPEDVVIITPPVDPPVDPTDPTDPTTPTNPTGDPIAPQDRTLPDMPTVKFESLYRAGDTFAQTVSRMSTYAVLEFGSDRYEFDDFSILGQFGFFRSFVTGLAGQGRGSNGTQIAMRPNTSTQVAKVPVQQAAGASNPLTFARVGMEPASGRTSQWLVHDLQLIGSNQPPSPNNNNQPHDYSGILNYYGRQSIYQSVLVKGMPGDYNAPPGETFQINDYKGINTIYRDVEVDGYNETGDRVGGSPLGFNNTVGGYIEDCYFHDSRVSSLTFSFSGSHTNAAAATRDVQTRRVKIERNANHRDASGQGFSCINHEGVLGSVLHAYSDLSLGTAPGDPAMQWDDAHITMYSSTGDIPFTMDHVKWAGGYSYYGGCFIAKMPKTYVGTPNTQVTPPTVIDRAGRKLTPRVISRAPSSLLSIDPTKEFILLNA